MLRVYHEQLCHDVKLGAISDPQTRPEQHKAIISASALFAREFIQDCNEETPFAKVTLSTLTRAVWTQSRTLALNFVEHSQLGKDHLAIGDEIISIKSLFVLLKPTEEIDWIC